DDPIGAQARGAGVGLDQKFAKWTYAGVEATWRQLGSPFGLAPLFAQPGIATTNDFVTLRARERGLRAYFYQVMHRTTTATVEYTFLERRDDTSQAGDLTDDRSLTHRVRLGLNYFDPHGWFAGIAATWRHQHLQNFEAADGVENGVRDFWIWDASLG